MSNHLQWSIGNGEHIRIREDKWLSMGIIGGPISHNEPTMVADFINREQQSWNISLLKNSFTDQIINEILRIQVRPWFTFDSLIWTRRQNGIYTIKSGYNCLRSGESNSDLNQASSSFMLPRRFWNTIWQVPTSPKLRIFLWSLCHNAIATGENLYNQHILSDPTCRLCQNYGS